MTSETPFGHVPTTAAALKALAAGRAAHKGGPSPFQQALAHALAAVLKITAQIAKQEQEIKAARKAGFVSVKHWQRQKQLLEDADRAAFWRGHAKGKSEQQNQPQAYTDLNDYGIAPDRDVIAGETLTLVNFKRNRRCTVSLVTFLNLPYPPNAKNIRRDMGWRLPAYVPPQPAEPPTRLPIRSRHRKIAA